MRFFLLTLLSAGCFLVSYSQADSLSYYLRQGEDAVSRGQNLPAYQQYRNAVRFDGNNPQALLGMARSANDIRYYAIARETYKKLLQVSSNDTTAIRNLMVLHFNTKQWQEAVDMAKRALAMNLGEGQEWIIAKSYYEMQQYRSALEYIEKASKKDSSLAEMAFVTARCQIEMNNYPRAITAYERALRLDPKKAEWMFEAGMTYLAIPDPANGVRWLEASLDNGYPRTREMLENMANAYIEAKSFDKAANTISEVLKDSPTDIDLLFLLGETRLHAGQFDEAIKTYNKILGLDPRNARSLFMSGIATIKSGDQPKGESICEQAIAMDPKLAKMRQKKLEIGL